MADDQAVAERGVLTAPGGTWDLAVRRADVIRELAAQPVVGMDAADAAAAELGVSRRQVYLLVSRWRSGEGLVSDLLPGTSSGGRGGGRLLDDAEAVVREVLRTRYLMRQRRTVASVCREITRECRARGLRVPSRGTVLRRIAMLDPVKTATAREGSDAARTRKSAGGTPPEITGLLEQVQADHTPVDVIVVDGKHRLPVGRPYVTVAIDVASRCVIGLVVTLEVPSATSVGLCLAHAASDKRPWLERLGVEAVWSVSGKPRELYVDNAAEFKSEALRRGCEQHGIRLRYRPPGQPHFGGIVERLIGTMMQTIHELPGTTFSSTADRGSYDSGARAVMTLGELQRWLALAVAGYHGEIHESLGRTPAAVWAEKTAEDGTPATVASETAFLLIVIFATSGALEAVATYRTAQAVRGLLDLAPDQATRLGESGTEQVVDAAALRVGDVILVRPGERIAVDGLVLSGSSDVDQATITGEPLPAAKNPGDEVFAGTGNGTGSLRVRVSRAASDTVAARIVAMVEQASATKAKTQLFIEKIEQRYSVGMVTATLLLFAVPLVAGAAFQPSLLRAMTFMIVASPCAVVLATMPPLLAAMANAGRHGVLVKPAVVMEQLGATTRVAFDKTGTLTEGTPRLTAIAVLPGAGLGEQQILALAAAAEAPSEHPLGRAVTTAARDAGLTPARGDEFSAAPGLGVSAVVDGRRVEVGSPVHLLGGQAHAGVAARVAELEEGGQTAAVVRVDGAVAALLALADRVRPAAAPAVARITQVTGAAPVLLTGDNQRAAARLAGQVGISDVRAGLLPQDKVDAVGDLQSQGARVLLVGDGINDAPALAAAATGAAMGRAGSDLALDTADAVIMRDDLATIPAVITLSRRARRVVTANLVIAAVIITGLVAWDLAGHLPLPLGVAGHEGSTVIVGLNGLRLLRASAWRKAIAGSAR